jgi:hypothetical protein
MSLSRSACREASVALCSLSCLLASTTLAALSRRPAPGTATPLHAQREGLSAQERYIFGGKGEGRLFSLGIHVFFRDAAMTSGSHASRL